MARWPDELPFFQALGGLKLSGPQNAVLRTRMSVGPDKVRRRSSAGPRRVSGQVPSLTRDELAAFETFFQTILGMGVLPFIALDPFTCVDRTFRFVGTYEITHRGSRFDVSAELEILP